jgi:hypothetical protein
MLGELVLGIGVLSAAQAQPCRITGLVVGLPSRAGISQATIVLKPVGRTTVADDTGHFWFTDLAVGRYVLAATVPGFAPSPGSGIEITAARCDVAVEIEYRLAMTTEARAENVSPALAPIAGPLRTTLDSTTITTTPGGLEDVFRALQGRPGVAASQDDRNDLLVRGGGAIENQTRIDGFDVPNPNHFGAQGGTGGGLSIIPPWLIRDATIEAGGFSVAMGERASSAVNLALRSGRADRFHASAGASPGGAMLLAEGPLPGRLGTWLLSGRRSFLELVFTRERDRVVPTYADALVKADVALGQSHSLSLLGVGARDGIDVSSDSDATDKIVGDQKVGLVGLRLDSHWRPGTVSTVTASAQASEMDVQSWHNGKTDGQDIGREVELRMRTEVQQHLSAVGELMAGISIKRANLTFDLKADGMTTPFSRARRNIAAVNRMSFTDSALYTDLTRSLPFNIRATAGLRIDHWGESRVTRASPRVKAEWAYRPDVRLVSSWGIYRQGIPYIWIGSDISNRGLPPITANQADVGLELGPWKTWRIALDGFDKRYKEYPVDQFEPIRVMTVAAANFDIPFVGKLTSGGRVHARGVDAGLSGSPLSNVRVGLGYSYWRVSQAGLDGIWRRAENELRHQARAEFDWRAGSRWSAGVRWRYVSGRPYTPYDPAASIRAGRGQYDLTRINGADYPPYHRLDLRADRGFQWGRVHLVLYAEVDNVYDRDNVYSYLWSSSLKAAKPIYQWGRTPIGGVRVEF